MRKVVVSILVLFAATASIVFAGSSGMPQLPERSTEREAEQTEKVSDKINKLRQSLNDAIKNEEFEKAAEIRDEIKALEGEVKDNE